MEVTIEIPKLNSFVTSLRQFGQWGTKADSPWALNTIAIGSAALDAAAPVGAQRDQARAKQQRTTPLSRSHIGRVRGRDGAIVFMWFGEWTSRFVLRGTKPHVINAKPGKSLAFIGGSGEVINTRNVRHPGTRPNPYPERAKAAILRALGVAAKAAVEEEFEAIARKAA